jgi:hypothetical protein
MRALHFVASSLQPVYPAILVAGRDDDVLMLDVCCCGTCVGRVLLWDIWDMSHVLLWDMWDICCCPAMLLAGEDGHVLLWDVHKMRHSLRKQQQRQQQQQGSAAAAAVAGGAAAAAAAAGLGLPQPRRTQLSDALAELGQPGLLFAHHGHIAAVEGLAWNPDR